MSSNADRKALAFGKAKANKGLDLKACQPSLSSFLHATPIYERFPAKKVFVPDSKQLSLKVEGYAPTC